MDILNIEFSDDQIFELLRDALEDITGYDGEITMETELIDELGLDSLGFLDLFFTIQTSIQKEVTNEQMRSMIMEELGQHRNEKLTKLSDGEIDRILYPELKVENFFNIIRRQLSNQIPSIDLDLMPDDFLGASNLDDFLEKNFQTLKQQQYEAQIKQFNITDERILTVIQGAFDAIDEASIKALLEDQDKIKSLISDFMRDRFDFRSTSNLKVYVSAAFYTANQDESLIFGRNSLSKLFLAFMEKKKEDLNVPEDYDLDAFLNNPITLDKDTISFDLRVFWDSVLATFLMDNASDIRRTATGNEFILDPDVIAQELLSDKGIQQTLVEQLVQDQIKGIFNNEVQRQTDSVEDQEIYDFVKSTFAGDSFVEDKIQQVFSDQSMSGDVFEEYMRNNFDRITMEESRRIVEDKDLRNRLVQDYIKENYDPMEAMQLNTPEAMREIQQAITKKYIDDNMDEIIARYMNEYMNEMLDTMPSEDEIEVEGDVQEEFMKKFSAHMQNEDDLNMTEDNLSEIEKFTQKYKIKDQMIQVFIESNFEEFQAIFSSLEKVTFDQDHVQKMVIHKYPLKKALVLYKYLFNESHRELLQDEFATYVMEQQSDLVIEIVMKRQLEFMWDDEKQEEENKVYQELFDNWFSDQLEDLGNKITEQEVNDDIQGFIKDYEVSTENLIDTLIDFPDSKTRHRVYSNFYNDPSWINELKYSFIESFFTYIEEEDLDNAAEWIELFFTQNPQHYLFEKQAIKQTEFWTTKLEDIRQKSNNQFRFRSDNAEPFSSLFQQSFISLLLSRWMAEMSLEFIDNNKRKIGKMNSFTTKVFKVSDWLNLVRSHVLIKRYVNGTKKRFEDELRIRCDANRYNFTPLEALSFLMNNSQAFIDWAITITKLETWTLMKGEGIDRATTMIDDLDNSQKRNVLTAILHRQLSKIDMIKMMIDSVVTPSMRKVTVRDSQTWINFLGQQNLELDCTEKLNQIYQNVTLESESKSISELKINPNLNPLFNDYISYLNSVELSNLDTFVSKLQKNMGMKRDHIYNLAEETIKSINNFFKNELNILENELLQYAQQIIVQKFDFLTADMVQQEFSSSENVKLVKQELEDSYRKKYAFEFFKVGLHNIIMKKGNSKLDVQRNQFRDFCRTEISKMIDRKAAEIRKQDLN